MYESTDDVLLETDDKMEKAIAHLQQGLSGLRTGKATPSLVDYLMVECYGTQTYAFTPEDFRSRLNNLR